MMIAKRLRISPSTKADFPCRLKSTIDARGLTLAEVARRASEHLPEGVVLSAAALRHYLGGRAIPRLRYLDALALGLGVEKTELIPHLDQSGQNSLPHHSGAGQGRGTVRLEGYRDEAHLWVEQRVPWEVAREILRLLGAGESPKGRRSAGQL